MSEELWWLDHQIRSVSSRREVRREGADRRIVRNLVRGYQSSLDKGASLVEEKKDDLADLNNRIWWIEHQIRQLTQGRGMRPGKAIRRALNTTDDKTTALTKLWVNNSFAVTIGDSKELFERAYDAVHSCMQGKGALCHASYTPHGVKLAVAVLNGNIVARGLVYPAGGIYIKTYGEIWYALAAYLEVVCGLKQGSLRYYDFSDRIGIFEKKKITEPVRYISEMIWCSLEHRFVDPGYNHDPGCPYCHVYQRGGWVYQTRWEWVPVFTPYLD